MNLAQGHGLILELYTPGATEWGDLVRRFDEQDRFVEESEAPAVGGPGGARAGGVARGHRPRRGTRAHDHDHHAYGHGHYGARRANAPSNADKGTRGYELYRCSWCGNPSAVLKKCGGCGKKR